MIYKPDSSDERIAQLPRQAELARHLPGARVELVGRWLWCSFPGVPSAETRDALKRNGWRWAPNKGRWYFAGVPSHARRRGGVPMETIRDRYGCIVIRSEEVTA